MICHRCGKCCNFTLKDGTVRKCVNLVHIGIVTLANGEKQDLTSCRIYNQRINRLIYTDKDNMIYCVPVEVRKLSMPKIGCGLANGDWSTIEKLIKLHLDLADVTVWEID